MRRSAVYFGLALAGLTLLGAAASPGCRRTETNRDPEPPSRAAGAWTPSRVAEVYFTTEVGGYLEPCGCTTQPLGGVQRLATVLGRGAKDRILVDAGALLLPAAGLGDVAREQHLLKARILARAYRQLGAVALNLGASDLRAGVELLAELQREGAFPLVSANLRPVGESGPSIARSFVRTVGDVRLGITGVATPELAAGVRGLTAIEHAPALRAEVSALRKSGAEVVLVLAHVGEAGARELAAAVPEMDVLVRAPGSPIEREPVGPERVGPVLVVEAGSQGQHVGRLTVALGAGAPERPIALDDAGDRALRRRKLLERKRRAYALELDAWRADPTKVEAVRVKEAQIAEVEAQLAAPASSEVPTAGPHLRVEVVALTGDVPSDPEMTALLGVYYGELRSMNLEKGDVSRCTPPGPGRAVYVGNARCAECHEEAYALWKKTKHARAWATLRDQGKHFDLTCIGCHTVGYQRPGGFCRLKDVGGFEDVGCESCHGPGSVHAADRDASSIALAASAKTCTDGCHVPEHSDGFVYETYLRQITGPGHAASEPSGGAPGR